MPQLIEYHNVSGKRWEWHLVLFKEWLRVVEAGQTERKYVKWLRGRKVFDRKFIAFVERLLGIEHPRKRRPRLGEVAEELLEELAKSERAQAEAQEALVAQGPGRDMPRSRTSIPRPGRGHITAAADDTGDDYKPPSADDDPFLKALLERFTELNPYLTMFVFKQIGDDFLSPNELFRRVGTNDFEGTRPAKPHFDTWVTWMEWLGGLKRVGFRHRSTKAGAEIGAYLIEVPVEELIASDDDDDGEPEEDEGGVAASEDEDDAPSAAAAPEATAEESAAAEDEGEDEDEDDEEEDALAELDEPPLDDVPGGFDEDADDLLDEEGLDLPPEAEIQGEVFWKQHDEPAPPPQPSLASLTQDLVRLQEDVARGDAAAAPAGEAAAQPEAPAADVPASRPEPAAAPPAAVPSADVEQRLAEQAAALEAQQRQLERQRQALEETQRQLARRVDEVTQRLQRPALNGDAADRSLLRQTVAWWLADGAALEPPASGVALRPHPSGKPVGLFRLLTFATLLEADAPVEDAKALFRALDGEGHLEAMATGAGDLEAVLDAAAAADAAPALTERLVHLARYRRGLERADPAALRAADARALARTLRDEVTGATLGGGLVLVLRELSAAGLAATEGLDAVAWLPSLLG